MPPLDCAPGRADRQRLGIGSDPLKHRLARSLPLRDDGAGRRHRLQFEFAGRRVSHGGQNSRFVRAELSDVLSVSGVIWRQPGQSSGTEI